MASSLDLDFIETVPRTRPSVQSADDAPVCVKVLGNAVTSTDFVTFCPSLPSPLGCRSYSPQLRLSACRRHSSARRPTIDVADFTVECLEEIQATMLRSSSVYKPRRQRSQLVELIQEMPDRQAYPNAHAVA
jgi:hypothetical protein